MLWFNPYLAERLAEESRKDAMREAEQARLIQAVKGPRRVREQDEPVTLIPRSLSALFVRPRLKRRS